MQAIGVPKDVTLLEFNGTIEKDPEVQQPKPEAQDMQLAVEELGDVVVQYLDHKPCKFIKGKLEAL
jgi:hypothetical protein